VQANGDTVRLGPSLWRRTKASTGPSRTFRLFTRWTCIQRGSEAQTIHLSVLARSRGYLVSRGTSQRKPRRGRLRPWNSM